MTVVRVCTVACAAMMGAAVARGDISPPLAVALAAAFVLGMTLRRPGRR